MPKKKDASAPAPDRLDTMLALLGGKRIVMVNRGDDTVALVLACPPKCDDAEIEQLLEDYLGGEPVISFDLEQPA
jgi:hypothetical protein